jgi:hypothetical protein
MAVGFPVKADYTTGDVLTAANMNDLAGTLNAVLTPVGNAAGKNKVINGDFGIWQRGTSFTSPGFNDYLADRWKNNNYNLAPTTYSFTRETFTPGTAPVAGYEGQFFGRSTITTVGSNTAYDTFFQRIEDVRTFAGQTVTLSFYAKSDSSRVQQLLVQQNFGSGGSSTVTVNNYGTNNFTTTTSWQRFTITLSFPSIAGKTIGTNSFIQFGFRQVSASGSVLDMWGVQLEAGSIATPFQTATGSLGGELALCQRYLPVIGGQYDSFLGFAYSTTGSQFTIPLQVTPRVAPTGISLVGTVSDWRVGNTGFSASAPTAITWNAGGTRSVTINTTTTAGSPTIAQNQPVYFQGNSNTGFILFTGCEL